MTAIPVTTDSAATADTETATATAKVPIYESSTQFRHWRFSMESLARLRASMNEVAIEAIRKKIEADQPGSSMNVTFLTPDEEVLLVKLYLTKITQLCNHFKLPEEVEATAVSYLKRFYLRNTVMDWHPKNVMLTALFLATKTCNFPIPLEAYTKRIPNTSPSDVLDLEFLVAQSLSFEFSVWHAHRALWGIWLDAQSLPNQGLDFGSHEVYDQILKQVRASRLTDAEFVYSPSQIALAAVALHAPELARRWFDSKDSEHHRMNWSDIEAVQAMIVGQGKPPDLEAVRQVDRHLKLCKNPEKVPGSKAFLAKKAEDEQRAAEKRSKKAAETQRAMEDDPFGGSSLKPRAGLVDYDDDDDDD